MLISRRHLTVLIAAVLTATAAFPALARADDQPKRDPLTVVRERLDAAREEANHLAERIASLQSEQARLESEIAEAEEAIPLLRIHAAILRQTVKDRAVELYVGHGSRLDQLVSTESVSDGARAATLTGTIAKHDTDLAADLRDTARELEVREEQLRTQRAELQHTLDDLAPLQEQLQQRLAVASAAYEKVRAAVERQRRAGRPTNADSGASACPVAGFAVLTGEFGELRPGGKAHTGVDLATVTGTPVVAVVDGVMRHEVGGAGGNAAWLAGSDQVSYYYAHFSRYEGVDRAVKAGDVIGYVGMTGNATGPHLHFEMHPAAGVAVDPFPLLLALCQTETARSLG
jgi:murein DD-endopeptidase MepM/ murein hydrolase activator NlpD